MGMSHSTYGIDECAYNNLVGKPEGDRPLGRPRRRWEENIRMDLREIGWKALWAEIIWLTIGTGGGSCEHDNEPSACIKLGGTLD
jgi:hypothetical protein